MSVYRTSRKGRGGVMRERWMIDVTIDRPGQTPRRIQRVARGQTEREAMREERELLAAIHSGTWRAPREPKPAPVPTVERPTFEAFAARWMQTYVATNNKPSERETKASILRVHLGPAFNALELGAVTLARVEAYKAAKLGEGLSAKTINNHLTVLRKLLDTAREWDELAVVPKIKWLKVPPPEVEFFDFDQAARLVAATAPEWRTLVLLALRTGLRLGELLALRWCDVDLERARLVVRRSVARGIIGTPKNGKTREVDLSEHARDALRAHRHLRSDLVFCDEAGALIARGAVKWPLYSACKRAGLPRVGWHVLRHTFASHLVMRGQPLKTAQELLGHATIEMTMRYAHLAPESRRDAVRLLDGPGVTPALLRPTKGG